MSNVELRQVDLARLAGVSPKNARAAMKAKLAPARTANGKRVFRDHPLVVAYINRQHPGRRRALRVNEAPGTDETDPFAPLITAAASLTGPTETVNRSAVAAIQLAEIGAESEGSLNQIKVGLIKIYVPIAEREIRKHNSGQIPAEAAMALEKMRAFASAAQG